MLFSYLYFKIQHPLPRVQISLVFTRVVNDSGLRTRFRNQNQNQSLHGLLESKLESESHDAGIRIEPESRFLGNTGIGR